MSDSLNKVSKVSAPIVPVPALRPQKGWIPINLRELWAYSELLCFVAWRDIKVCYKQRLIGFACAVTQPLFIIIIFSLFFGTVANDEYALVRR